MLIMKNPAREDLRSVFPAELYQILLLLGEPYIVSANYVEVLGHIKVCGDLNQLPGGKLLSHLDLEQDRHALAPGCKRLHVGWR